MKFRSFRKALGCALLFASFGALDYVTGYEVTSFPLYLVPIALSFFYFGKMGGYLAVIAVTALWLTNDFLTGHTYQIEVVRYWNAGARLLIYGLFVYGLSLYAKTLAAHRRRVEDLRRILPMCHGCGRILWKDGIWKLPAEALAAAESEGDELPECPGCVKAES